jgi:hypothetical protein
MIDKDENEIWKKIVYYIESTQHSSIISKIKDMDIENSIKVTDYKADYDFNAVFIHKIREFIVLFQIILDKLEHKDALSLYHLSEDEVKNYRDFLELKINQFQIGKYGFKTVLIFKEILYYLIPFLIMLISSYIFQNQENIYFFNFFLGLGLIIFSIPIFLFFNYFFICSIKSISYYLKRELDIYFKSNFIVNFFLNLIFVFLFTFIILKGVDYIESNRVTKVETNCVDFNKSICKEDTSDFHKVFHFFKKVTFEVDIIDDSNSSISNMFISKNKNLIPQYILTIKAIILIMMTLILYYFLNLFIQKYDYFFYEQRIKRYLLPPELLKTLLLFILIIISIGYFYYMTINYPYTTPSIHSGDTNATTLIAETLAKQKTLEDLLPFGLFIALISTILTISTKDVMNNYFAGLSMKINSAYNIGDRVIINNSKMLEVKEIGTRNDKFYEIATNSIRYIPHSILAKSTISNYTLPTLDYRNELVIYVQNINEDILSFSTPREAEKILLLSAFINTGVKLPSIDKELINDIKLIENIKLFEKYEGGLHQDLEDDLELYSTKIDRIWKDLNSMNEKNREKLFFTNLFIKNLPIELINTNKTLGYRIKKVIIAIVNIIIEYEDMLNNDFPSHSDRYGIRRKHMIFDKKSKEDIHQFANILVDINFYYYMLANRLWELKNVQTSLTQKSKIDSSMTQILNVPRVGSTHEIYDNKNYWKLTLYVTLELGEQGDETLHHINLYIDKIWSIFLIKQRVRRVTC